MIESTGRFISRKSFGVLLGPTVGILKGPVYLGIILILCWIGTATAAEVIVKGQDLEGSIVGFTADGVDFETVYGEGAINIPWSDIERLQSDKEFMILFGDSKLVSGKAWGIENGELLVGQSRETADRLPVDQIMRSLTRESYDTSWLERQRVRFRYWSANFDFGFDYTDATTDSSTLGLGLELQREKKPTRFFFGAYYRFGTTQEEGEDETKTEDRLWGVTRLDVDISERVFAFGSVSAEYDAIQEIRIRTDPTAGLGYRFVNREDLVIAGRAGPGYLYTEFFDGDTNDYFAAFFGGDLDAKLPYDSELKIRLEYLPAVDDWADNYLFRGALDWTVPIIGWLNFKLSLLDTYNNQPPPDTVNNSFTTIAGLSVRF